MPQEKPVDYSTIKARAKPVSLIYRKPASLSSVRPVCAPHGAWFYCPILICSTLRLLSAAGSPGDIFRASL